MQGNDRLTEIRRRLVDALAPAALDVTDESHKHVGHSGARDGRGHYRIFVRAASLAGMTRLQKHRKIYAALGDLMQTDIHAVSLDAEAAQESGETPPEIGKATE